MSSKLVAVVTGGASGIGRALAQAAAARGMAVAVADIDAGRAQATATEIVAAGGNAKGFACDVTSPASLAALAEAVRAEWGTANFLFNNAGVCVGSTLEATSPGDAQWLLTVNVLSLVHATQAFLPLLRDAAENGAPARIINTGSENSLGLPALGPTTVYTASKHAVLGLSDGLRRDLDGSGIAVSVLCPGFVQTEIYDSYRSRPEEFGGEKRVSEKRAEMMKGMMGKIAQTPDITARVCFDGIDADEFIIIADPRIRGFAEKRHAEVTAALDHTDARLAALGESYPAYD